MNTPLSRPFLIVCGLLNLGFGLAVLLAPEPALHDAAATGLLEDFHGSHGGLNLAAGLFLVYAAFSGPWHRPGVLLVALMNGGYLAGRVVTLLVGDALTTPLLAVMALEFALCAVAVSLATPGRAATA